MSIFKVFYVQTALDLAKERNHNDVAEYLQSIADLNQQLRDAAKKGDLEEVTRLRDQGAQINVVKFRVNCSIYVHY
jgi:excinuclease UvrABC helicase subunit UvrB